MNDFSRKIVDISRIVLSLLFLGVLVTSMGSSADRLFGELLDEAVLLSGGPGLGTTSLATTDDPVPAPEGRGKMAPGERSESHRSNSQITPLIIGQDKPPSRLKAAIVDCAESALRRAVDVSQTAVLSTSAAVNSSLGRQFTLVGARPSGTS
ncbi:MAG: hypothetical protein ABIE70_09860 [bacterium]